jgi:hypothetical protein
MLVFGQHRPYEAEGLADEKILVAAENPSSQSRIRGCPFLHSPDSSESLDEILARFRFQQNRSC